LAVQHFADWKWAQGWVSRVGLLFMWRNRVMDHGLYAVISKSFGEAFTLFCPDYE
jgi:hypothetical protein